MRGGEEPLRPDYWMAARHFRADACACPSGGRLRFQM